MSNTKENPADNIMASGSVFGLIVKFGVPGIVNYLIIAAYSLFDQILVSGGNGGGRTAASAALSLCFPVIAAVTAVGALVGAGAAACFSMQVGKGNRNNAVKIVGNAVILSVVLGLALSAALFAFAEPLLSLFSGGAGAEALTLAVRYTRVTAFTVTLSVFVNAANSLIRADGSPALATAVMAAGAAAHCGTAALLVYVFKQGIFGVAVSTNVGFALSAVLCAVYFVKKFRAVKTPDNSHNGNNSQNTGNSHTGGNLRFAGGAVRKYFTPDMKSILPILKIGFAPFVCQITAALSHFALNYQLKNFGNEAVIAAAGSMNKINIIFMSVTLGITQGVAPVISYNCGAGAYSRVSETLRKSLIVVTVWGIITFAVFRLLPYQLAALFGQHTEQFSDFAAQFLRIYLFMAAINGGQYLAANTFTALGKPLLGTAAAVLRQAVFFLPLLFLLPQTEMFGGLAGMLYAAPVADLLAAAVTAVMAAVVLKRLAGKAA